MTQQKTEKYFGKNVSFKFPFLPWLASSKSVKNFVCFYLFWNDNLIPSDFKQMTSLDEWQHVCECVCERVRA